ncbi:kinase PVPK-1 [Spatholobus suberectus]|nr:kinase PVPK-1 [Spatholobus suberectus]
MELGFGGSKIESRHTRGEERGLSNVWKTLLSSQFSVLSSQFSRRGVRLGFCYRREPYPLESSTIGKAFVADCSIRVSGEHHDSTSTYRTPRPSQPPLKASRYHGAGHQTKTIHHQNSHAINKKHSYEEGNNVGHERLPTKLCSKQALDDLKNHESSGVLESDNCILGSSKRVVANHA